MIGFVYEWELLKAGRFIIDNVYVDFVCLLRIAVP